jgi:hypothetical protein
MKHPEDGWVVVREFSARHEAEIVVGYLRAEGIDAMVYSDDAGSQDPALTLVRGAGVCVPETDEDRARTLLDEREADTAPGSSREGEG